MSSTLPKKLRKIGSKLDGQPSTPAPSSVSSDDESVTGSGKLSVRKETEQRRRNMMNQHFDELVMMLSMITDRVTPKKMDKTSILEEVVHVLRQYYDLDKTPKLEQEPEYKPDFFSRGELFNFLLDSLGAFLMFVSSNGRILYSSDLITSLTGHMPTRLVGQTIYDCVVPEDEAVLRAQFIPPTDATGELIPNSPMLAYPPRKFKCSLRLYSNDPSAVIISRSFVCLSYLRQWTTSEEEKTTDCPDERSNESNEFANSSCILLIGKLSNSEWPRDHSVTTNDVNFEFSMRVSKEGKILEIDKQASLVLGFTRMDIQGTSFFEYIDPYHSEKIGEAIETFLSKGLGMSQPYRMLSKSGQYIWVVSKGFLSYNPWNHKPDHVLLQSRILGCDEVLPEYKFKVDSKVMPNPNEDYNPIPLMEFPVQNVSKKVETISQPLSLPVPIPLDPPLLTSTSMNSTTTSSHLSRQDPALFPSLSMSASFPTPTNSQDSMNNIVHELERKNQELFELQRRMLEQQQLFEQERRKFYQVTNQVMAYIGKNDGVNVQSHLDPNMSMAIGNTGTHQHVSIPPVNKMDNYSQFAEEPLKQTPQPYLTSLPHTYTSPLSFTQTPYFSQAQTRYSTNQFSHLQPQNLYSQTHPQLSQNSQAQQMYSDDYSKPMPPTCTPNPNSYVSYGNMSSQAPSSFPNSSLHSYPSNLAEESNIEISQNVSSLPGYCHQVPP